MEKQSQRRRRLVLISCPFQGHLNPTLELASILYSHGFSITIIHTKFNSPDPSIHPEFDFQVMHKVDLDDVLATRNLLDLVMALNERCKVPLKESLEKMINLKDSDDEIGCVIHDDFMYFSAEVAYDLKLPSIVLRTASLAAFLSKIATLRLRSEGLFPLPDSMLQDFLLELPSIRGKDLTVYVSEKEPDSFYSLLANSCDLKRSSAVIWNTMDCLEEPLLSKQKEVQSPVRLFTIGPMHKLAPASSSSGSLLEEDRSCISWLDNQKRKSVLYISMGSVVSLNEKDLSEMAWVLSNRKQPFLWVIKPGSIPGSECIELFPQGFIEDVGERGCIVKWAPQKEVLAHPAVGGFWTHCGWNSTLESIAEGVPMICSPSFGDQIITTRYVSNVWGIGLDLEGKCERNEIERCVKKIMEDEDGHEMRHKAMVLKENVEKNINKGGSSSDSLEKLVEFISSL